MELKSILEAVLFTAQKPLTPQELAGLLAATAEQSDDPAARAFRRIPADHIVLTLAELEREHAEAGRSYRLRCVAGAWQFASEPEFAPWLRTLLGQKPRPPRLSQPALETLAIIAYRQPVTRAEVEQVRGVSVDGVLQTLLERGLVEQAGRADVPGRPMRYATTALFLEYFGLASLEDLPAADELRRIEVKKPEALLTLEPGLATVPPEQLTLAALASQAPAPPPIPDAAAPAEPPAAPAQPPQA
jgi:segregation and condensation protein B